MSHTTRADLGTTFVHNGDYSGTVTVHRPCQPEINVPFADLRQFVLGYLRGRMISDLEDMSDATLEQALTRSPWEAAAR
jgi:hypothetical protein